MTIEEIESLPVFFIVGAGRSGTTLLRTIFDAHSNISIPPEGKIIMHLKCRYAHVRLWNENKIQNFVDDLFQDRKFEQFWRVDREKLIAFILSLPNDKLNFKILIKIVYLQSRSLFNKENIIMIGDKNPVYSIYIEEILEIFPDARFIHLVRDPRDVIVSNRKHFKRKDVVVLANFWFVFNHYIETIKSRFPNQFYTVNYERLANNPIEKMKEICHFIQIEYKSEMLDYHKRITEIYQGTEHSVFDKMFSGLLKPVQPVKEHSWENEFTPLELKKISFVAERLSEKYGYLKMEKNVKGFYFFHSFYGLVIQFIDIAIIKTYYLIPFSVRKLLRIFGDYFFIKFGFITVYNEDDKFASKS